MSIELPSAPVDTILRRRGGDFRIGSGATERLAQDIQEHGASVAKTAAELTDADGRKTIMQADIEAVTADQDAEAVEPESKSLTLPIAPVDRIARLELDGRFRVGADARVSLAAYLEGYAESVADGAAVLARHADRRTVIEADVETYLALRD